MSDELLKQALIEIEQVRQRANDNHDFPPSDYHSRVCQAIIAEKLGFDNRAQWHTQEYLGIEVKI
ncbi:MAG: hypothetical protein A4E53_01649 [Pelotomaculum sp. PtaB.Bin104]|nr:MAG: hypothetical protein A4E53_01649 [Pelotomaculum sp. PtaB.Bin104]